MFFKKLSLICCCFFVFFITQPIFASSHLNEVSQLAFSEPKEGWEEDWGVKSCLNDVKGMERQIRIYSSASSNNGYTILYVQNPANITTNGDKCEADFVGRSSYSIHPSSSFRCSWSVGNWGDSLQCRSPELTD